MLFIFVFSLIVLLFLIGVKIVELQIGSRIVVSRFISKGDYFLLAILKKIGLVYKYAELHMHRLFTEHLPAHGENLKTKVSDFAESRKSKMQDIMRGRRTLRSDGSVSFFLKQIGDGKTGRGEV